MEHKHLILVSYLCHADALWFFKCVRSLYMYTRSICVKMVCLCACILSAHTSHKSACFKLQAWSPILYSLSVAWACHGLSLGLHQNSLLNPYHPVMWSWTPAHHPMSFLERYLNGNFPSPLVKSSTNCSTISIFRREIPCKTIYSQNNTILIF